MPDIPKQWWEEEGPTTGKTFFGLSFREFKALPHREQLARMAADDQRRGVKPVEHKCPVYGTVHTKLVPTKKRKKS